MTPSSEPSSAQNGAGGEFTAEVVSARGPDWDRELAGFLDATIYQTMAYGIARWGVGQLLPVRILRGREVVAMALVRTVRLPLVGGGIAYMGWGPAWHRRGTERDPRILQETLLALKRMLVEDRGCHLRIVPNLTREEQDLRAVFEQAGFTWSHRPTRTILVGLSAPLEKIRAGFRRTWRQQLAKSERNPIEVRRGAEVELYDIGLRLFDEMHARKGFADLSNVRAYRRMQTALPEELKMQVLVCLENSIPVAAIAWSVIGQTGLPLLAATGARALENGAAYVMWWRMLEWMKSHGMAFCDLGGISQERNPGGYRFKTGLAETHGREVEPLGDFDAYRPGLWHGAFLCAKWCRDARAELARLLARWRTSSRRSGGRQDRADPSLPRNGPDSQSRRARPGEGSVG